MITILRNVVAVMLGWYLIAAVLGVFVGSTVTVMAWRVPRGLPLPVAADRVGRRRFWADAPMVWVHSWRPDGREPEVAVRPPTLELITGALFVVMVARLGVTWSLPAYLALASAAVLLSVIDLQHHRLPNQIVGPFAVAALVLLALGAAGGTGWEALLRAVIGGAILFAVYFGLALISPASLGMGDVKLAGVLGLYLAYLGWRTLILGGGGAFVIAGLLGVVLLAARRVDRRTQLPFGPSMFAATLVAVAFGADSLQG